MKVVIHYNLVTELNCVAILLFQNKSSSPVKSDSIDNSSSILMLHYDMDIKVAYVAGKVFLQKPGSHTPAVSLFTAVDAHILL
jgi:hypothetical protein